MGTRGAVGVGDWVMVGVSVRVAVSVVVNVEVGVTIVTVAPTTGRPLKRTGWPLVPAAPVMLNE